MTSNQKLLALLLGVASALLIVAQFALGQILTTTQDGEMRLSILKYHKHTGYLTAALALAYILTTMWWIVNSATRTKGDASRSG